MSNPKASLWNKSFSWPHQPSTISFTKLCEDPVTESSCLYKSNHVTDTLEHRSAARGDSALADGQALSSLSAVAATAPWGQVTWLWVPASRPREALRESLVVKKSKTIFISKFLAYFWILNMLSNKTELPVLSSCTSAPVMCPGSVYSPQFGDCCPLVGLRGC